jgi:hypothetical protein
MPGDKTLDACQHSLKHLERRGVGRLIGELAPLLSVLGHQMHKRHKSACTPNWDVCPDLDTYSGLPPLSEHLECVSIVNVI